MLAGRGARPPTAEPNRPTTSLIDLRANPHYDGPNKPKMQRIVCFTDQWAEDVFKREDLNMLQRGSTEHIFCTWRELPFQGSKPKKGSKQEPRPSVLKMYETHEGFRARPTGARVLLRFRCDRPPFNNLAARKAFASAVDRDELCKYFWPAAQPIERIVPSTLPGAEAGVSAPRVGSSEAQKAFKSTGMDDESWVEIHYGESPPGQDYVATRLVKAWKKAFGVEPGESIQDDASFVKTVRAGSFFMLIAPVRASANDPYAYLGMYHSENVDGGTGWSDKVLDGLLEGAKDPAAAKAKGAAFLDKVKADARLRAAANGDNERFRLALLGAAERRLLDEFVIVPIGDLREAEVGGSLKGMGSDQAWSNPAFVGALWNVHK